MKGRGRRRSSVVGRQWCCLLFICLSACASTPPRPSDELVEQVSFLMQWADPKAPYTAFVDFAKVRTDPHFAQVIGGFLDPVILTQLTDTNGLPSEDLGLAMIQESLLVILRDDHREPLTITTSDTPLPEKPPHRFFSQRAAQAFLPGGPAGQPLAWIVSRQLPEKIADFLPSDAHTSLWHLTLFAELPLHFAATLEARNQKSLEDLQNDLRGALTLAQLEEPRPPWLTPALRSITVGGSGRKLHVGGALSPVLIKRFMGEL